MTSQHKTGTHPFLWQASIRPILIHFYDKLAKDRHSSIFLTSQQNTGTHPFFMPSQHNAGTHPFFKTSQHNTGTHPFLWQASIRPILIHFYDKLAKDRHSSIFLTSQQNTGTHPFFMPSQHNAGTHPIFKTSQHNTGTHPFYIGMYIHICTHIYVHIFTSQKECLHIFSRVFARPDFVLDCCSCYTLCLVVKHFLIVSSHHFWLSKTSLVCWLELFLFPACARCLWVVLATWTRRVWSQVRGRRQWLSPFHPCHRFTIQKSIDYAEKMCVFDCFCRHWALKGVVAWWCVGIFHRPLHRLHVGMLRKLLVPGQLDRFQEEFEASRSSTD